MVDPARLVDHIEVVAVIHPEAVSVVFELIFPVEDAFYVSHDVPWFEALQGDEAVAMDGRPEHTKAGIEWHGTGVCTAAAA
jgi:hypothetical protein